MSAQILKIFKNAVFRMVKGEAGMRVMLWRDHTKEALKERATAGGAPTEDEIEDYNEQKADDLRRVRHKFYPECRRRRKHGSDEGEHRPKRRRSCEGSGSGFQSNQGHGCVLGLIGLRIQSNQVNSYSNRKATATSAMTDDTRVVMSMHDACGGLLSVTARVHC